MMALPGASAVASVLPPPPGLCDEVAQPCGFACSDLQNADYQRLVNLQLEQRRLLLLRQAQLHAALGLRLQVIQAAAAPLQALHAAAAAPIHAAGPCGKAARSSSSESTASGDTLELGSEADDAPTTVIMKKMPKAFTAAMLQQLLEAHGFHGAYDFLYAPMEFERMVGTGCAFINFRCHEQATRFMTQFQGFHEWNVKCGGTKRAELSWSVSCQGRQAHIDRYKNSPVMHAIVPDDLKPMLFDEQGKRQPFPDPTEIMEPPRAFQHFGF